MTALALPTRWHLPSRPNTGTLQPNTGTLQPNTGALNQICTFMSLPKPIGNLSALFAKNLTHDVPPLSLAFEEAEAYQMRVPPRKRKVGRVGLTLTPQCTPFSPRLSLSPHPSLHTPLSTHLS